MKYYVIINHVKKQVWKANQNRQNKQTLLVSQEGWAIMFGNGSQVVPWGLAVSFKLFDLAGDFFPIGFGAATEAAQVSVQVSCVFALFQDNWAQMLEEWMLVDSVFDLRYSRQIVELETFRLRERSAFIRSNSSFRPFYRKLSMFIELR